jgi:hypothetical protein
LELKSAQQEVDHEKNGNRHRGLREGRVVSVARPGDTGQHAQEMVVVL